MSARNITHAAADPALWTLTEAQAALAKKRISSLELTKACLKRIERFAPRLNSFLSVEADDALKAARAADRARAKGDKRPLLGIPLAHKDMFARRGKTMSRGGRQSFPADKEDATVIARLNYAGALHLGPLHMVEFAFGPTGHNEHDGPARNAWNPAHITGGSSSGTVDVKARQDMRDVMAVSTMRTSRRAISSIQTSRCAFISALRPGLLSCLSLTNRA